MWTLIIWTFVIANSSGVRYDWRPVATNLNSESACEKAARKLTYNPDSERKLIYRCIGPNG